MSTSTKKRKIRHQRIRKKITGTESRPRLVVHFSERNITAQVVNDITGTTIASVHTTEKHFRDPGSKANRSNVETAKRVGIMLSERAKAAGIEKVALDRAGFQYHGKLHEFAAAARAGGLEF